MVEFNEFNNLKDSLKSFDFISDDVTREDIISNAWKVYNDMDKSDWLTPPNGSLLNQEYKLNIQALIRLRNISLQENKSIHIGE